MSRPLFQKSIVELEDAFNTDRGNPTFLETLLSELEQRSTKRATALKEKVSKVLEESTNSNQPEELKEKPLRNKNKVEPIKLPEYTPQKAPVISNSPENILTAWSALEILSPEGFKKPEDLAAGDKRNVARLDTKQLPWEGVGEKSPKGKKLYYHVVLGTLDKQKVVSDLMQLYADKRAERPIAIGEVILATVTVDRDGRPALEPAASISSFSWGVPRALSGNLQNLNGWEAAERSIGADLHEILYKVDSNGDVLPITRSMIDEAYTWLVNTLSLPDHLIIKPKFAIRKYVFYKNNEPPESLLLNSFFLNDLSSARTHFENDTATPNLKRYLGVVNPKQRHNLLEDSSALERSVAPSIFPKSCWPAQGHHPLVLLQQAGVNLAMEDLKDNGILAINGPPGTGKTTLLRDIISEVVTQRANIMAGYETPADAFTHSGKKIKAGNGWLHLYKLDQKLRGFEILVTSSNNKAVENVSAELPSIDAIADDIDLRYFKTLSDKLTGKESWGTIAAVLGNSSNRYQFKQAFWWDKDFGLATYLAEAAGTPQYYEEEETKTKRKPTIIQNEDAPNNLEDALSRWKEARKKFNQTFDQSQKTLEELEEIRQLIFKVIALRHEKEKALDSINTLQKQIEAHLKAQEETQTLEKEKLQRSKKLKEELQIFISKKPNPWKIFLDWLFRRSEYKEWRQEKKRKWHTFKGAQVSFEEASSKLEEIEDEIDSTEGFIEQLSDRLENVQKQIKNIETQIDQYKDKLGDTLIDDKFSQRSHEDKQGISPWFDKQVHKIRETVFVEAIKAHKAFIDAAAKPLKHNLGALMNVWDGKSLPENNDLLPDLWASLFLVVPSVSTTFASVERMLGKLPPESLGWLLIDEAGQALPQAAVGALLRTKRAVVVGDPIQIEPVVTLPEELTESICRQFGVDPDDFNAPTASAQTLADTATPYMAEFTGRESSRTVGVPLLVHRRCSEPMFSISNAIAYEDLMINKKTSKISPIEECLGPSKWIDISGSAREKWCPEEGEKVLELLDSLKQNGVKPNLYIVTPFVVVQDNLRQLIRTSGILEGWVDNPYSWVYERIGTVHTVQGREAEAVIFVLGAPDAQQRGARNWAGSRPNLLNVAVTRAKEVLYVVGNRKLWKNSGTFKELNTQCS